MSEPSQGLGDTVAKVTSALGVKPCPGCKKRQAVLNRLVPYGAAQSGPIRAVVVASAAEVGRAGIHIPTPTITLGCPLCGEQVSIAQHVTLTPSGPSLDGVIYFSCGYAGTLANGRWFQVRGH